MARILVVDDEPAILTVLDRLLKMAGYETALATAPEEALSLFEEGSIDLLLTDLRLNADMNGFDVMTACRRRDPALPTIVITAYGTVETAVQAMRKGAADFVCKPFFLDDLRSKVEQALKTRQGRTPALRTATHAHFGTLIGESPAMHEVYARIGKAAKCDLPVLIEGDSGTGKELVATAIHRNSSRGKGPWTAMNCAAISPLLLESEMFGHAPGAFTGATERHDGMFIAANRGTLFLDEIGTLRTELQAKLLRALEEGEVRRLGDHENVNVDVRVLAATNTPLQELANEGTFRPDLLYRLSVIDILLPPLNERDGDIPLLASAFCLEEEERSGKPIQLGEDAARIIAAYEWPGNVRELQNAIACAAALTGDDGVIAADMLPPRVHAAGTHTLEHERITRHHRAGDSLEDYIKTVEREYVDRIVEKTGGNRSEAANLLGISRATFYRKYGD